MLILSRIVVAGLLHRNQLQHMRDRLHETQSAFTYSKLTVEAVEQGVKYVQS